MKDTERARKEYIERYLGKPVTGNAKMARDRYIFRMTHGDANEDEERDGGEVKHGGNTRLPYGLCEEFGIKLPEGASPKQAWEALEGKGVSATDAYKALKEDKNIKPYVDKVKKETQNKSTANKASEGASEDDKDGSKNESGKTEKPHYAPCTAATNSGVTDYIKNELKVPNCSFGWNVDARVSKTMANSLADNFARAPKIKDKIQCCGSLLAIREEIRAAKKPILLKFVKRALPSKPDWWCEEWANRNALIRQKGRRWAFYTDESFGGYKQFNDEEKKEWAEALRPFAGIYVEDSNTGNYASLEHDARIESNNGFHPKGCDTIKSIMDHEVGHLIDHTYGISKNPEIRKLYNSLSKAQIETGLSSYPTSPQVLKNGQGLSEFIAEAWSEYLNNTEPREIAKQVGDIITEVIKNDEG
ncbi:MAG: hypothetical protein LUD47_07770 [Clostridia bacterium]|nr:hypothetical protein [Clostridia bacterium]